MSTRPIMLSLDTLAIPYIRDMSAARGSDLPRDQHALMTRFGAPEQVRACYLYATASTPVTYYPSLRVMPGVTDVGVGILVSGTGTVAFTVSGVDATGSSFRSAVMYDTTPSLEEAARLYNGTALPTTESAAGRALTVRTSVLWECTDVELTVTITPDPKLYIYEMSFVPLHVPR